MQKIITMTCALWMLSVLVAAEEINITKITCAEAQAELSIKQGILLTVWLDGYLAAKEDSVIFDVDEMIALSQSMAKYCDDEPDASLLEALQASK